MTGPPRGHAAGGLPASLSVVLPAFNEEAVIGATVRDVLHALRRSGIGTTEVLVVDDGSSDETGLIVEELRAHNPTVRLLRHTHNRGYGAALRTGFDAAGGEAVLLMDSDGQFDADDIGRLLPHWAPDTLVAGYRERRNDPAIRTLNHRAFFALVHLLFGRSVRDMNCALKLFPRAAGQGLSAEGAMISAQLVLRARNAGYRLVDVPVRHLPRTSGHPTGANWRVVLRAFGELARMRSNPEALRGLPRVRDA